MGSLKCPLAAQVDEAREQLLANARLSFDQQRRDLFGLCDPSGDIDGGKQCWTLADNCGGGVPQTLRYGGPRDDRYAAPSFYRHREQQGSTTKIAVELQRADMAGS